MTERELAEALEHESGLRGLAGSADMREVLAAAARDEPAAVLALDVYVHRLRARHRARWRRRSAASTRWCSPAAWASARRRSAPAPPPAWASSASRSTPARNAAGADGRSPRAGAAARTLVVEAREDLEIARGVRAALG